MNIFGNMKPNEIKSIIKKYFKEFAKENDLSFYQNNTMYRVKNDILQSITFNTSIGNFDASVNIRPLYNCENHTWVINLGSDLEGLKKRELISAFELKNEDQVAEKLNIAKQIIREDVFEWFSLFDSAQKILDFLLNKVKSEFNFSLCSSPEELIGFSFLYLKDYKNGEIYIKKYYEEYRKIISKLDYEPTQWMKKELIRLEKILNMLEKNPEQTDIMIQEIIQKVRQNMKI